MNNDANLIYQMFRQSPFPGASSIGAISGRLDEMKKDKRWREEYDLKKKQIESAIGYRDLMKKLQEEKSDRDKKDIRKLEEYKKKNLQMGQTPVTAQTGLSPYGALAQGFGGAVSGLPGMGALGKGIEAFGKRIPGTITEKPTPATIEERRRNLYKETFPEKVYGKEPKALTELGLFGKDPKAYERFKQAGKVAETMTGYKTMAEIPEAPKGMVVDKIGTNKFGRFEPTYKKVDKDGKPIELFATFRECQNHIKGKKYKAIPKRDSKTGKYYPSYKEPTDAEKSVDYKKLFHQYEMKRLSGGTVMEMPNGFKMSTGVGRLPEITLQDFKVWYDTGKLPKKSPVGGGKEKDWKKYLK